MMTGDDDEAIIAVPLHQVSLRVVVAAAARPELPPQPLRPVNHPPNPSPATEQPPVRVRRHRPHFSLICGENLLRQIWVQQDGGIVAYLLLTIGRQVYDFLAADGDLAGGIAGGEVPLDQQGSVPPR